MVELSPEEKEKIYLEEKERIEAQERIKTEKAQEKNLKQKKDTKAVRIVCLVILVLVLFYLVYVASQFGPPTPEMKVDVNYLGMQFLITNKNDFDWSNIELKVNDKYECRLDPLKAGQRVSVSSTKLSQDDGTMFNPLLVRPKHIVISARTIHGFLVYVGDWN